MSAHFDDRNEIIHDSVSRPSLPGLVWVGWLAVFAMALGMWFSASPKVRTLASVGEFVVSGLRLRDDERQVESKWGQPLQRGMSYGFEFLYFYQRRLPQRDEPWNTYVELDSTRKVVGVSGSALWVRGEGLNQHSNHADVIRLFGSLSATEPTENSIERQVYSMCYRFWDGEITIYFDPSGHATQFGLSASQKQPYPVASEDLRGKVNPLPMTPGSVEAGKRLFSANCIQCHSGKRNFALPSQSGGVHLIKEMRRYDTSELAVFTCIRDGLPKGPDHEAMRGWKSRLSETEIWQLVTYLHCARKQRHW